MTGARDDQDSTNLSPTALKHSKLRQAIAENKVKFFKRKKKQKTKEFRLTDDVKEQLIEAVKLNKQDTIMEFVLKNYHFLNYKFDQGYTLIGLSVLCGRANLVSFLL